MASPFRGFVRDYLIKISKYIMKPLTTKDTADMTEYHNPHIDKMGEAFGDFTKKADVFIDSQRVKKCDKCGKEMRKWFDRQIQTGFSCDNCGNHENI